VIPPKMCYFRLF